MVLICIEVLLGAMNRATMGSSQALVEDFLTNPVSPSGSRTSRRGPSVPVRCRLFLLMIETGHFIYQIFRNGYGVMQD